MSDFRQIDDHSNGRYRYRGFRIVVRDGEPTVALVMDPWAPEQTIGPIVRRRAQEALCTALSVIDAYCREEAADVAARLSI